jgi:hypothetical protein
MLRVGDSRCLLRIDSVIYLFIQSRLTSVSHDGYVDKYKHS